MDPSAKKPTWHADKKYMLLHLKGRPVPLYAPSSLEDFDVKAPQDPPEQQLKLEWVYGYRGHDCGSNMYTLSTGEVIYFNSAVVVLHNFDAQTQRHYQEHTDDIKCMAIHPDGTTVATGQVRGHEKKEGKPHVRIWECINLTTLHVIGEGEFQRGVSCVSFSKVDGGKQLLVVDEHNDHILTVWDISGAPQKIAESKTSGDPVTQCEFHPVEENSIVCCGKSQITFWTLNGDKLIKKAGIFGNNEKAKWTICFCFADNGDVISGDSGGNIYVWEKGSNKISKAMPASHAGSIYSLCFTKEGVLLSGGGKDRKVIQWDSSYQKTGIETEIPEELGAVRMLCQGPGDKLFVGTVKHCILQGSMDLSLAPVVEGHKDEVWGLDTSQSQQRFLTCAYDKHLYLWDAQTHSCVWRKEIADPAHCCSIHPGLEVAAVGLMTGKCLVIDLGTSEILAEYSEGKKQYGCIQYSPDGKMLAVGCHDFNVYVYTVSDDGKEYQKAGILSGHGSFLKHIDWSADGEFIRSNSGDYEVLYWHSKTCTQELHMDNIRDIDWATNNCALSFNAVGIWPYGADGTDINNCAVSHNKQLIVGADDYGKVNLLKYPSTHPRAPAHSYPGHSSHVTMAKFLFDDSKVISTGGRDMSVMQWQVI